MIESEAYFLSKFGAAKDAFVLKKRQINPLEANEVLIEVDAFGLNYADVMARKGLYREAPPLPCVLGYEVVGTVRSVGNPSAEQLIGKRVVAFCRFGGYSKQVVSPIDALCEIHDLPTDKALALATQYVTAYYMVEYAANIQAGERVLIHAAAGGVGIALIQLCTLKQAEIIAKVSSTEKANLAKQHGAQQAIIYTEKNYSEQLTNGIDISFNPVGGSTFKLDFSKLRSGGKLILFGGSELSNKWGIFSKLNFVRKMGMMLPIGLMIQSKSVLGVNMLRIADDKPEVLARCLNAVVQLALAGKINPVSGGSFHHTDLGKAHELLESGTSVGKISIHWHEQ
jgi:NADPH2:quinone reductase